MQISMRDRYRGAMVGTLCGDALGAPYEWQKSAEVKADLEQRGGLVPHEYEPFDYIEPWKKVRQIEKGQPTDDSELAAALAKSLIESRGMSAPDIYTKLRSFIIDRQSILTDVAYGVGSTLKASLTPPTYEASVRGFERGEMPTPPSNGSLMRCISIPLFYRQAPAKAISAAQEQSMVTHRNPESLWACCIFSALVLGILKGRDIYNEWGVACLVINNPEDAAKPERLKRILKINPLEPTDSDIWLPKPRGPGDVMTSLWVAAWAAHAPTFAEGIMRAIRVGGDTDTYAAIAGGILGARFGIESIPEHWLNVLKGREVMLELADKLFDLSNR